MKMKVECVSQINKGMSHSKHHKMRLMIDEDKDLFDLLGRMYEDNGVVFEITIEEVDYIGDKN